MGEKSESICKILKIFTIACCLVGFILNSLAIFNNFANRATTIATKQIPIGDEGIRPPTVSICAQIPFEDLDMLNVTYESFDANTIEQNFKFGSLKDGRIVTQDLPVDVTTLYTLDLGRCYVVNFKEQVCRQRSCGFNIHSKQSCYLQLNPWESLFLSLENSKGIEVFINDEGFEQFLAIAWVPVGIMRTAARFEEDMASLEVALELNVNKDATSTTCYQGTLKGIWLIRSDPSRNTSLRDVL